MPVRVLIVDDSAPIRRLVRSLLQNNPEWEICGEAEDGARAVELVRELKPDAVVLDFSMPKMNGLDAAQHITVISPKTRMVLFTVHDSSILRSHARTVGINAVVAKGAKTSLEDLQHALREDGPPAA